MKPENKTAVAVLVILLAPASLALGFWRAASREMKKANAYREIAYELVMSMPDSQDRADALKLLAQTDEHD